MNQVTVSHYLARASDSPFKRKRVNAVEAVVGFMTLNVVTLIKHLILTTSYAFENCTLSKQHFQTIQNSKSTSES